MAVRPVASPVGFRDWLDKNSSTLKTGATTAVSGQAVNRSWTSTPVELDMSPRTGMPVNLKGAAISLKKNLSKNEEFVRDQEARRGHTPSATVIRLYQRARVKLGFGASAAASADPGADSAPVAADEDWIKGPAPASKAAFDDEGYGSDEEAGNAPDAGAAVPSQSRSKSAADSDPFAPVAPVDPLGSPW